MYDDFSSDYDRFVDWPGRLAVEMPFIETRVGQAGFSCRILDAACGTGMHAVALAQRGYTVVGADLSAAMIERAQANAVAAGADVRFVVAGFGGLAARIGTGLDVLLCLGNSLPHLLTPSDLDTALADFAACLRPGGLLFIQNRNFDAIMARRERWMEPQSRREGEAEWLFLRFYDFDPDGLLTFNLVTLRREGGGTWQQRATATRLRPLLQQETTAALTTAGFGDIVRWGNMQGAPFDPQDSPNLVITAHRL